MRNEEMLAENAALKAEVAELKNQVAWLMEQLKLSKRRQFGVSSEKSAYDQLSLFNETEATLVMPAVEPEIAEVKAHSRRKSGVGLDRLPADLPVEIVEHELPEDERICPDCGGALHIMGRETGEQLKLVPAKAVIVRHIRHVYACRHCETNAINVPIVKAKMPAPVIKGSFASPETIAQIMTQKFVMGVPLYRQQQEWERQGINLSRQTMSNWLIRAADEHLKPLYERLRELLIAQEVLHADETTLQVLHEPDKAAQSKSYMWLYRTSGEAERQIVLYDYRSSRSGKHAADFLQTFKGFLHTDGYAEYHRRLPEDIRVVGCWAHCRRKFAEALVALPEKERASSDAERGKQFCDRLFSLEREFAGLPPDNNYSARYLARLERSKPVMEAFFAWAEQSRRSALPKMLLGKAVSYAIDQRLWLERVLADGRLELSNNRAERSIKPFVIGRKNWLFSNTPNGANASALIYSIIETAKENGINPFDYLSAVFHKSPNLPENTPADVLLPWNLCQAI